jgi:hypothetical protein
MKTSLNKITDLAGSVTDILMYEFFIRNYAALGGCEHLFIDLYLSLDSNLVQITKPRRATLKIPLNALWTSLRNLHLWSLRYRSRMSINSGWEI